INEVALVCRNGNGLFLADFDFYALRDFFYPQMVVQLQRHTDAVKARSHIGRCGRYPYMNHNRSLLFSFFPFSLPIFAVKNKTRLIRRRCGSISLPFYLLFSFVYSLPMILMDCMPCKFSSWVMSLPNSPCISFVS